MRSNLSTFLSALSRRPARAAISACVFLAVSAAACAQDLNRQVTDAIAKANLPGANIGVSIIDVQTGRELAAVRKNDYFIPASNMKLLTSAAAISMLGSDYEFRTELVRLGDRLVIRGAGDPALADPALLEEMNLSLSEFIDRLAQSVVKAGIKTISEIIIDDRVFDRDYVHPDWPKNQLNESYCAEISGLNFHANVLEVFGSPSGKNGDPAAIRVEPNTSAVEIRKKARTVRGADAATRIGAVRQGQENIFTIIGTVSSPTKKPAQATLHEGSVVLARMLAERLAALGVGATPVEGVKAGTAAPVRLATVEEELGTPDAVLAVVRTPLSVVMERCNSDSENLYAESLCKLMGNISTGLPGTWGSGGSAIRMQIRERLGPEFASRVFIADGSGMSRSGRVTPSLLASWLVEFAKDSKAGPTLIESIPRAGMEGTMANRFRANTVKNEIRGKSGYINSVRTLSGYVTNVPTQRRIAYSVLINDIPASGDAIAKDLHEKIVQIADQWLTRQVKNMSERERIGG